MITIYVNSPLSWSLFEAWELKGIEQNKRSNLKTDFGDVLLGGPWEGQPASSRREIRWMVRIRQIFENASTELGVRVLTPEYEIVLALMDTPHLTADELFDCSSLSRAGFFNTIDRLKNWGILMAQPGVSDRRQRIYKLPDELRVSIISRFKEYRLRYIDLTQGVAKETDLISKKLTIKRRRGLNYFSTDFKILFYLYLRPSISNRLLRSLIDVSYSNFHVALRMLVSNCLVTVITDPADKRVRLYSISAGVSSVMSDLHSKVFWWLDLHEDEYTLPVPSRKDSASLRSNFIVGATGKGTPEIPS